MFSLALTDLLAVIYHGFIDSALPLFGLTLKAMSNITCVSCNFFSWTISMTSYYVTILFSLDKCIAVLIPFKYREHGKPMVCVISTVIAYAFCGAFSLPAVLVHEIDQVENECRLQKFDIISYDMILKLYIPATFLISGIVPVVSVIILTAITIVTAQKSSSRRRRRSSEGHKTAQVTASILREREMTKQMIVVGLVFSSLCLGVIVCIVLQVASSDSSTGVATENIYRAVQDILILLTNSVNFFIYIGFGHNFRKQTFALFGRSEIIQSKSNKTGAT